MKEFDKLNAATKPSVVQQVPVAPSANPAIVDKKIAKLKAAGAAATGIPAIATGDSSSSGTITTELEHSMNDESSPSITIHEIQASMEEEDIFKILKDTIPNSKLNESSDHFDLLPAPFVEQIIHCERNRRGISRASKSFTLLQPASIDQDEDSAAAAATDAPPANTIVPTSAKPEQQGGKKSRTPAQKVAAAEEVKAEAEEESEKDTIAKYRWILQPKEKRELVLKFSSNVTGKFEQSLNFEIVGCVGRSTFNAVGLCQYSQIQWDFKKIFSKWRKFKDEKAILFGEYVISSGTYEFGPLLCAKPRDKYLEKFPENKLSIIIANTSVTEIKLNFALRNDIKGDTFFFDPSTMELQPGQTQNFNIWAYPRGPLHYEDQLICCVKDNPEPYIYRISCDGVKPELEIDKKYLAFDKLLLGRKDQREIRLKNNTLMPVCWRLLQVESLGEEFDVSPQEGMLEPYQDGIISATFHGSKPVVVKRVVRLEVFDTEKIGGIVQEVPILVTAEAYDIAMDLHFPKGYDGVDFGVLKVFDEGKLLCSLKNKGKYEVGYRFIFENKEFGDILSISPQQGIMQPSDKPFSVQVLLKTTREMTLKDVVSFRCQFYEPTTGEVTATIPVKMSARVVFSKFSVLPVRDLNFGALLHGTKGSRQFVIENLGEFDFKYSIYKILQGTLDARNKQKNKVAHLNNNPAANNSKSTRAPSPPPQKVVNRREFVGKQADAANFGAFTVFPTSGSCPAGQKQQITVEFHPEVPGSYEEIIAIDISDRSPNDQDVVEYRLVGESCIPGINTYDFTSIFEEQTVVKRLEMFNSQGSVYSEEDRVFFFGAYLAGQLTQAKVKISNPFKVPCDVTISTRPRSRTKTDASEFAFDVEPKRFTIQSHEYRYAIITFHPLSIQSYAGIFEAIVENVAESRTKTLSFELRGEGTLPRVAVEKPSLKNKVGISNLKFKRLLIGSSQTLPIIVRNEGIINARIKLEWVLKDGDDFDCPNLNIVHSLKPLEQRSFDVKCRPSSIRKFDSELKLRVLENSFEDTSIVLTGEGYVDDFTFENMPDGVENEITFNDCAIRELKQVTFEVANHSSDYMRVVCPDNTEFAFTPSLLHVRPRSNKQITVSFYPKQPCDIKVPCVFKVCKIKYATVPVDLDWDNRHNKKKAVLDLGKSSSSKNAATAVATAASLEGTAAIVEPQFDVLSGSVAEYNVFFNVFADVPTYECDVSTINFKPTLMYQTRVYQMSLKNTGKVLLRYNFLLFNEEGQQVQNVSEECAYSVTPTSGTVEAGELLNLMVRFSPTEEGTYNNYHLVCLIPNLSKDQRPLNIVLNGTSLRPFCHFEVESSEYINNERLNPEIILANGTPSILEQGTQVIEFGSCGVKVKNTKRFYILNPTFQSWEFEWEFASGNNSRIFKCLTPKGVVTPMKKFEIIFEFTPETIDLKVS